ncbi:organic hydroperoxide resistance protein [Rhodovastum sp. RN2-1]|uniref:Organic hydroperoxide resistance protein n=2 Tax=Limobrevibacterium gyesilva TaxID=2991712 RepID=A0AA41YS19_9PROT|nr:organic hydroperoxide resistance protein [Limobrevibacterium gyesilva]
MGYTAIATTAGGRNGHVESSDGLIKFDLSVPKGLGGPGKAGMTNPEQLFAAGYSACFGSAIEFVAHTDKVAIAGVAVTADVTIDMNDGGFFLAAKLKAKIDGVDRATAQGLLEKAHQVCPYSKATRGNIKVELELL